MGDIEKERLPLCDRTPDTLGELLTLEEEQSEVLAVGEREGVCDAHPLDEELTEGLSDGEDTADPDALTDGDPE